jgi:hypothetical protein
MNFRTFLVILSTLLAVVTANRFENGGNSWDMTSWDADVTEKVSPEIIVNSSCDNRI